LEKVFALVDFKNAKTILFYASFNGEVDTFAMMAKAKEMKKNVVLPITLMREEKIIPVLTDNFAKELESGPYGIKQPRYNKEKVLKAKDIDAVIVPAVAFDKKNYRLGRGKGFYDRFLADISEKTVSIGLAFDFQVVDDLPHEEHDIRVNHVITN
jgi:5-formyltetrahydrofolate cyclo-ligase